MYNSQRLKMDIKNINQLHNKKFTYVYAKNGLLKAQYTPYNLLKLINIILN